jgi:hypothetical protein
MRLFVSLFLLIGLSADLRAEDKPRPATAEEIALFKDAMKNSTQDTEHWAYTETTTMKASKGSPKGDTIVRFDPSKPYAEQFTPVQVEGKPPTERQLKEYRKRGEKRGEKVARAADALRNATTPPPPQLKLGGSNVSLDVEHPLVVSDEADRITLEVPLLGHQKEIPLEKFQILVRIGKAARLVEHVNLTLRESFRVKLVAKVKAGEASMDFTVVDPKFGPLITTLTGTFDVSVLFIPVNGTFSRTRTDWQRVKSFDERLKVKLAPLQMLDF